MSRLSASDCAPGCRPSARPARRAASLLLVFVLAREMVETLLAAGARPNLGMRHGNRRSPLGEAVMYGPGEAPVYEVYDDVQKRETGLAIVELLVKGGADVKQAEGHGDDRRTALDLAASYGKLSVVKRLLALGVDVNLRNGGGRTALHAAAEMVGPESAGPIQQALLETLRAAGANVNAEDDRGDPPLCRALWGDPVLGRLVVIELLLEWGGGSRLMEQCYQSGRAWAPDETIDRLLRSRGATDTPAR